MNDRDDLKKGLISSQANHLLRDVKTLIEQGRHQAFEAVNSALTLTYWHVMLADELPGRFYRESGRNMGIRLWYHWRKTLLRSMAKALRPEICGV
jgi:hypothetical protein